MMVTHLTICLPIAEVLYIYILLLHNECATRNPADYGEHALKAANLGLRVAAGCFIQLSVALRA